MDIDKELKSQYERYKQLEKIDYEIVKNNQWIKFTQDLLTGCVKILGLIFGVIVLLLSIYKVLMDGNIKYYALDISEMLNNFDVSSKVFLLLIIYMSIILYAISDVILKFTIGRECKAKEKD